MENQPKIDRGLLVPIILGAVSVIGIGLVFTIDALTRSQAPAPLERTATPFKYLLLATETSTANPELEAFPSEEIFAEETFPTDAILPDFGTAPPSADGTPIDDGSDIPTDVPSGEALSLTAGKYDDADISFEYFGEWAAQTNIGTAYQGTLHVSNAIGSDMAFTFEGEQLQLGYYRAPGLGTVVITIDEEAYLLDQRAGNIWVSPQLTPEMHFVIIIHEDGDSINLDYITIIGGS